MLSISDLAGRAAPLSLVLIAALTVSACTPTSGDRMGFASARDQASSVNLERRAYAVEVAKQMRAKRQRVWCVPFARNASGIDIRGNAKTWWSQAKGLYARGHQPKVGAVMAFSATGRNPLGHIAVVSGVDSPRQIRVDHANWERNKVSLDMVVVDVSEKNDWSRVRVMSNPGALGRVYPITGFISKG
ncbi:CHAP domain-containing protein [Thioclava sp. DLFJ4-1]|uniref:CHAP domain-containing protein n=1 Tax=Thioclava sp. DLFJ4-1 TaxID=1915313 RepID=UPI000998CD0E|nr:CHAP domain-containing protein [Thioclava sp. DLFJ4-1]OOY15482.1 CHAP domain-containing protein [Thioclava sp. DLFJ4-1]